MSRASSPTRAGRLLCGIAIGLAAIQAVTAQNQPAARRPAAAPTPEPVEIEGLGLRFVPPPGASLRTERVNDVETSHILSDGAPAPSWTIRIQRLAATLAAPTAEAQAAEYLASLRAEGRPLTILGSEATTCGGVEGWAYYVRHRPNDSSPELVQGWLFLPQGERSFVVFSMLATAEAYPVARPLWDACFQTITIRRQEDLAREDEQRFGAAREFLNSLSPDRLQRLVGQSQWFRIYKPAPGESRVAGAGEQELGCSFIEVNEGRSIDVGRADIDQRKRVERGGTGLLVRVQGRFILDGQRGMYHDFLGVYWMAWDQSEEVWSVIGTQRQGSAERSEAESGVRLPATAGEPRSMVRVITSGLDAAKREVFEWETPPVYLSQALGWVVGHLLPRDPPQARSYAWYAYNSTGRRPNLSQRSDQWEPAPDGTGQWQLATRLSTDTAPYTSTYGRDGRLLRRTRGDGSVTEPIDVQELRRHWAAKGLEWSQHRSR